MYDKLCGICSSLSPGTSACLQCSSPFPSLYCHLSIYRPSVCLLPTLSQPLLSLSFPLLSVPLSSPLCVCLSLIISLCHLYSFLPPSLSLFPLASFFLPRSSLPSFSHALSICVYLTLSSLPLLSLFPILSASC